ncbi:MAG: TolC family protein [Betaproteobacteria bacterium HGW-Betaproteobacteria-11]|nr:MAG: TolC family protein [Betaproteobacteria bacterium HGW-Betaproteobacteria-11]
MKSPLPVAWPAASPAARYRLPLAVILPAVCLLAATQATLAAGFGDPFDTRALHATGPGNSQRAELDALCRATSGTGPLTLAEVVDLALCTNPRTRLAWANARAQAAQVGIAESAYLPTLSASASRSRNTTDDGTRVSFNQTSGALSASYLLFDFGARAANLENARQLMAALVATQDATLQSVFLSVVQAYYQSFAAGAAILAAREAERASLESLKAAETRYRVGVATPADRLQAQTAAAQATLARIQAEGNAKIAEGVLANTLGLDAQAAPALVPPAESSPDAAFEQNLDTLIAAAKHARPELAVAEAQVKAAEAGIAAARAAHLPSLSLTAGNSYNDTGTTTRGSSIGLTVSIPLFSGFATTYRVRNAEALLEARAAQREQVEKQVSLDVWRSYYTLTTSIASVRASSDLLASAEASEKVAAGRYKAGVGGILDLLNAQSALAAARQQKIQALYNWHIAKTSLAQSIGRLGFDQLEPVVSSAEKAPSP